MNERDELMVSIAMGVSLTNFFETPVGKHITEKAEAERASALEEMASVDPFDGKAVAQLQRRVAVVDGAMQWLADTITEGHEAQARLAQFDQPD